MELTERMQRQAKALGDPTRFQILEYITSSTRPVGVAELTELLGFNHNAIRQHLTILTENGLIAEYNERRNERGRPRKQYRPRADAFNAFKPVSGSYRQLSELLLRMSVTGETPHEVGYNAAVANPLAHTDNHDELVNELMIRFTVDGFEPETTADGTIRLGHCPIAELASAHPEIVCEIHRGLVEGYLTASADTVNVELRPRPALSAGCEVTVTRRAPTPAPDTVDDPDEPAVMTGPRPER